MYNPHEWALTWFDENNMRKTSFFIRKEAAVAFAEQLIFSSSLYQLKGVCHRIERPHHYWTGDV